LIVPNSRIKSKIIFNKDSNYTIKQLEVVAQW
jgi:hypothetical protein